MGPFRGKGSGKTTSERKWMKWAMERIADLEAEVERLRTHLRGCCGEDYESCEAIA